METHLKILILEDNPSDAELLERFLKKEIAGCSFRLATNKESFTNALEIFIPDVILSDHSLPQFDSGAALKLARSRFPNIPFILVTGTVSEEYAVNIIKAGADDYILKDRIKRLPAAIAAILQKKKSEKSIRHSEAIRKLIMNSALDAIICINTNGEIIVWTPQAEKVFGWKENEMIDKKLVETVIPQHYRERHIRGFSRYLQTGEGRILNTVIEITALNRAGEQFPIELLIIPIKDNGSEFFCAFVRDITERKKLEAQLLEHQKDEQLKITATALEAQEKERNAIAEELHDSVNQILVGTKLILSMIKDDSGHARSLITTSIKYIQDAIDENRKLAHALVTPDLDTENLVEQIGRLCKNMLAITGITVVVDTSGYDDSVLDQKRKIAIYRILQEQCTNIVKYAGAAKVSISLSSSDKKFRMTIADDGVGMEADKGSAGIGLRNINSRLSIYKGSVNIITSPGNGFRLDIEMPL